MENQANGLGKVNKKLTSVEKATSTILKNIPVLSSHEEIVLNSLGKTLAKPVTALLSNPPSDVSSMDGYALKILILIMECLSLQLLMRVLLAKVLQKLLRLCKQSEYLQVQKYLMVLIE